MKCVGFWLSEDLRRLVDLDRKAMPFSHYVRLALKSLLEAHGHKVEEEWVAAPDRQGKGGRKKKI